MHQPVGFLFLEDVNIDGSADKLAIPLPYN